MNSKLTKSLLTLPLLAMVFIVSACAPGKGAKVVSFCDRGARTVVHLQVAQLIDEREADRILSQIAEIRAGGVEYIAVENSIAATAEEEVSKREKLRVISRQILASVARLEQDGIFHVKNAQARQALSKALAIAQIALDFTN